LEDKRAYDERDHSDIPPTATRILAVIKVDAKPGKRRYLIIAVGIARQSYTQKLWMRVKRKAAYLPG
jgi:hypothetical protein